MNPPSPDESQELENPQPSSSIDNSQDLERIRQWIDHQEWDVLDESSELQRDKEICFRLLRMERDVPIRSYGTKPDSSMPVSSKASNEPNVGRNRELTTLDHDDREFIPEHAASFANDQSNQRFVRPELLGTGAFGIVFSVFDQPLGFPVALKILRPSKSRSHDLRARFLGEAQATAMLSHPGIVRVYDTGQIGSLPYITSALIEGGSLAKFLSQNQTQVTARQAAWLMAQVAAEVHYAHSKALLHRDLKPGNILLESVERAASEGLGFRPLLTDFGLAKRLDQVGNGQNLTREGGMLGTTRYMSPEQARGAVSEVGTTSDIFSLGIILYELTVGRVPFDAPQDEKVRQRIVEVEPERPRSIRASIPQDLEGITLKCLSKSASERYQSAHELQLDLERFLSGEPVEAAKSTWFRRASYSARKHPIAVAMIAVTLLANTFAMAGLTISLYRERAARQMERTSKEREQRAREADRLSKIRERAQLKELVSIYSDFADKIYAGTRVRDEDMLASLQSSIRIVNEYIQADPTDEETLHQLSVLKHFVAIAYQHLGQYDQSIKERSEVLLILGRLLESHPDNKTYRFQRFHSHLLLGHWLVGSPSQVNSLPISGLEMLEMALVDINQLAVAHPEKIEFLDALAATKLTVARQLSTAHRTRRKLLMREAIEISERLWRAHPDRPVLAKHAMLGYTAQSRLELEESDVQAAYQSCSQAIQLHERAWAPISDDFWVIDDSAPIFDAWVDVLIASERWEQALVALDKCDGLSDAMLKTLSNRVPLILRTIHDGAKRIRVLRHLNDEPAVDQAKVRLRKLYESAIEEPGFREAFQKYWANNQLPEILEAGISP